MLDVDSEWENFINNSEPTYNVSNKCTKYENEKIAPLCSDLYISTKTKIEYLTNWEIPASDSWHARFFI